MEARDRVLARHPKTLFVGLHVGHDAENLAFVSESLDRFPNLTVEIGARIGELGRQPRTAREFFEKLPGPDLLRHRRRPAAGGRGDAAAGLQGRALRDLLPLPRDRRRVLRLRAGAGAAAGPLAHLRHRACPTAILQEGLPRERRAAAGARSMTAAAASRGCSRRGRLDGYEVAHAAARSRGAPGRATRRPGKDASRRSSGGPRPTPTRFRALWSDDGLFLRFDATDPSPWHTMTRRDEHLWDEEVVEIFLDPDRSGRDYYELEVSPANVVCDLRMISPWPDKKGDIDWNLAGLETRVHRSGARRRRAGWTATAFLPWRGLRALPSAAPRRRPAEAGRRLALQRVPHQAAGRTEGGPEKDAVFAAWSPPSGAELPRRGGVPRPRVRRRRRR